MVTASTLLLALGLSGCDWWRTPPKPDSPPAHKVITWDDIPGWE